MSLFYIVLQHIDEGRLKMKDGYTMLTDVALKERFIQAMLSYNTPWLKMGLHVVLGHGALLVSDKLECPFDCSSQQNAEEEKETQNTVLRWIIERHFMTHPGLAKHHATNKLVFFTCSSFSNGNIYISFQGCVAKGYISGKC